MAADTCPSPRKVILDCDTGSDDAIAILMAVGLSPSVILLGVTTVHGNCFPDIAYDNTRRVLAAAGGIDVPVVAGAACELRTLDSKKRRRCEGGGEQGQAFDFLPKVSDAKVKHSAGDEGAAAQWIIDTVRRHGPVDLVLTGPLTNVALALRREPTLAREVGRVTIMGGCFDVDWAYSEFNFASDALAAAEVLSADWAAPPVLVGLNVTCQALLSPALVARITAAGRQSAVARTAAAVVDSIDPSGWNASSGEGWEMFDACALAAWVDPGLVSCDEVDVWINPQTGFTSLSSEKAPFRHAGKHRVAKTIDSAAFFKLLLRALKATGKAPKGG
mmetsp:Transcript_77553/g.251065  ORF Transcript_77553/g.251065 Transcript_77553/m.251065 type:complete len:332 (-) Transcript_77553:37-1032(-)